MQIRGSHMARGRNGTWTLHIYWGSQAQLFRWCSLCGRFLGSGLRLAWMLMIWNCGIRFFCASFSQKIGRIESRLPFSPAVVGHVTTPWLTWIFFADCDLINTHTWLRENETWTRVSCLVHLLLLWADAWLFCFPRSSFIRKIRSCNCCQKSSLRYIFFSRTLIASRSEHVFYILQAHGLSKIPCFHTRTQVSQWALRKGHPMTQVAGNTAGLSWNRRYQPFPRPAAGQHNAHWIHAVFCFSNSICAMFACALFRVVAPFLPILKLTSSIPVLYVFAVYCILENNSFPHGCAVFLWLRYVFWMRRVFSDVLFSPVFVLCFGIPPKILGARFLKYWQF